MGCLGRGGDSERQERIKAEHQWSYLNLSDFTAASFLTPLSYGILWISLAISVACYVVDVFTCSQLLLFDKWSGTIEPAVPLYISRWVFTGAILLSFVLLGYRWWKAVRAIRTGGITQSYLDPLAIRLQSVRVGTRGRGWRRFLVFAELTKSKKGVEYVALFTYYSFEAWARILFAEGPRQAINAITLAALMKADVIPVGTHGAPEGTSPVAQFFFNLRAVAQQDNLRAAVLFGMLFTVIVWIFAFLSLCIACLLWVVFLWHTIPKTDSGLRKFCKRKVESRLQSIVDATIKKALAKEEMKRAKQAGKGGDVQPLLKKQPTLPVFDDQFPDQPPPLSRQTTASTLPEYPGPPTSHDPMPTLPAPAAFQSRPPPSRSATQSSHASYMTAASAPSAYRHPSRGTTPALPPIPGFGPGGQPGMSRHPTATSVRSQPAPRTGPHPSFRVPVRQNTAPAPASARHPPPSRGLGYAPPPPSAWNRSSNGPPSSYRSGSLSSTSTVPRQPTLPFTGNTNGPLPPVPHAHGRRPSNASSIGGGGGVFVPYTPYTPAAAPYASAAAAPAPPAPHFSRPAHSRGSSSVYSGAPPSAGGGSGVYDVRILDSYAQDRDSCRMAPPALAPAHALEPRTAVTRGSWF